MARRGPVAPFCRIPDQVPSSGVSLPSGSPHGRPRPAPSFLPSPFLSSAPSSHRCIFASIFPRSRRPRHFRPTRNPNGSEDDRFLVQYTLLTWKSAFASLAIPTPVILPSSPLIHGTLCLDEQNFFPGNPESVPPAYGPIFQHPSANHPPRLLRLSVDRAFGSIPPPSIPQKDGTPQDWVRADSR